MFFTLPLSLSPTCQPRQLIGEGRNSGGCSGSSSLSIARKSATKLLQPSSSYSSVKLIWVGLRGEEGGEKRKGEERNGEERRGEELGWVVGLGRVSELCPS